MEKMDEMYKHYEKVKEIVKRFPNGEQRMKQSALFNRVVQTLARDADVYALIDQLINVTEDTQKAFEHHLLTTPPRFSIEVPK